MNSKRVMAALLAAAFAFPAAAVAGPGAPKGWIIAGSAPADYEFGTEHVDGSAGKQSAYIKAKPNASAGGFGTLMQTIKADNYIGQRLRVSANLKSTDAGAVQLWMRVDGEGKMLGFYNMNDRPIKGTTDWKRYDIVLDVPAGSTAINYGFFVAGGKGAGWADAFALDPVNKSVPVSNFSPPGSKPVNMNFDQ
jgi:hypothetical protein